MTQESPPKDNRRILAVIDTNVFISAFISKKTDVATVRVIHALFEGRFTPLYHAKILDEYDEVLHRSKFRISSDLIRNLFIFIKDVISSSTREISLFLIFSCIFFQEESKVSGDEIIILIISFLT